MKAREQLLDALRRISLGAQNSSESKEALGRIAREAIAAATPYNAARIAWELERTAMGDGFFGNALRVAKDIPAITDEDRALLDRWATGAQQGLDGFALQDLALRIDQSTRSAA